MKPEESVEGHQTLFSLWEGGVWARDYICYNMFAPWNFTIACDNRRGGVSLAGNDVEERG